MLVQIEYKKNSITKYKQQTHPLTNYNSNSENKNEYILVY